MRVALFLSMVLFMTSCDKDPGEGGTSAINGEVYKIFTFQNPNTGNWDTSYYQLDAGKDVFIIYSDNQSEIYDDKFETDYNGRYHFEYLRNGNYTIYGKVIKGMEVVEILSELPSDDEDWPLNNIYIKAEIINNF